MVQTMPEDVPPKKSPDVAALAWEFAKSGVAPVAVGVAYLFLNPFSTSAAVWALLMGLGSWAAARRARHLRSAGRSGWPWQICAWLLGAAIIPWVAASPFLTGTDPLYVVTSSQAQPAEAFLEPLIADGKQVASLLFISDPIRKFPPVERALGRLAGARLRRISAVPVGSRLFFRMPLINAIRKSAPSASSASAQTQEVQIMYHGLTTEVGPKGDTNNAVFVLAIGMVHRLFLDVVGSPSNPWYAIPVGAGGEPEAFRYACRLDLGLTAVSLGDYPVALALLDDAGLHAPSAIERARTLVLMGRLTSIILNGSVGELQGLSLYYDAYRIWAASPSGSPKPDNAEGPVAEWLSEELREEFAQFGTAYPEIARFLKLDRERIRLAEGSRARDQRQVLRPMKKPDELAKAFGSLKKSLQKEVGSDKAEDWFGAEFERLARLGPKQLAAEAKLAASKGPDEARWFAEKSVALSSLTPDEQGASYEATATAAGACNEPWRSQLLEYLQHNVDVTQVFPKSAAATSQASALALGLHQLDLTVASARRFKLHRVESLFQDMVSEARAGSQKSAKRSPFALAPAASWWTTDYIDWFLSTALNSIDALKDECDHQSISCEETLMKMRPWLCYDGSNERRLFAPGLGFALMSLGGQRKIDPWWFHAFYFGVGATPRAR
jgi:hypothetical protein